MGRHRYCSSAASLSVNSCGTYECNKYRIGQNDHDRVGVLDDIPYSVQLAKFVLPTKPGHPSFAKLTPYVYDGLARLTKERNVWMVESN